MAEELLRLSIRYGFDTVSPLFKDGRIPDEIIQQYEAEGKKLPRYKTVFSAEIFALALTEWVTEAGVDLHFDTALSDVIMDSENPNKIRGIVVLNKGGLEYFEAKMFVDTTGDADLLARAGVPTVSRENFNIYRGVEINFQTMQKALEKQDVQHSMIAVFGSSVNLYGSNRPEGSPTFRGEDPKDVNRYLISNQISLLSKYKDEENRKNRTIVTLPGMCQFRTVRRMDADYVMQTTDAYRHFDDSIAAISDFDRRDYLYEVPYRTLVRSEFPNVITAGRSAAADGYMWDALRVIPPAILTGQAAGLAVSHAIDEGADIAKVNVPKLQEVLVSQNAFVHFDDADVPKVSDNTIEYNDLV